MKKFQSRFLHIFVLFSFSIFLSVSSLQKDESCYKTSMIHFKDDHCPLSPSSYEQLKTTPKLCANVAFLGYHEKIEKYIFLTNELSLIGFEDESNVWTKTIKHVDIDKYNFTIIKSQLLETLVYILAVHNDSYYFIDVNIGKGDKELEASIIKFGHTNITFVNLECGNIFFIKAENNSTIILYKKDGPKFIQEKLKNYNLRIKSLKQVKPSKFEVHLIPDGNDVITCEQCLRNKKDLINKGNESKNESPVAVIQIISDNVGIVIVLSIFCVSLLIIIIALGICYLRRRQKKKRRNVIKRVENNNEILLDEHFKESVIPPTPNVSSVALQNDDAIPVNLNATLAGSKQSLTKFL